QTSCRGLRPGWNQSPSSADWLSPTIGYPFSSAERTHHSVHQPVHSPNVVIGKLRTGLDLDAALLVLDLPLERMDPAGRYFAFKPFQFLPHLGRKLLQVGRHLDHAVGYAAPAIFRLP